ncbi:MAG: DUF2102 domain-containing protein [Candidatus Methanomethylophilaceae archaeon]
MSERETRLIFISPLSDITPDQIARTVHSLGMEITVKETCYGAMIEGDPKTVHIVMEDVKKLDPDAIFTKIRGFPLGDERRCRAHHGSRPGFSQLEMEWADLSKIEYGLKCAQRGEIYTKKQKPGKLSVLDFQKICEEVE